MEIATNEVDSQPGGSRASDELSLSSQPQQSEEGVASVVAEGGLRLLPCSSGQEGTVLCILYDGMFKEPNTRTERFNA
jgi:hypothetical protein